MGRGRRPNLALEPTRSLQTQRAFRQRKAEHLANLEDSVKALSEENRQLRSLLRLDPGDSRAAGPHPLPISPPVLASCSSPIHSDLAKSPPSGNASLQCSSCAQLEETKERISLAAKHVEQEMRALNQAMVALRSVLATEHALPRPSSHRDNSYQTAAVMDAAGFRNDASSSNGIQQPRPSSYASQRGHLEDQPTHLSYPHDDLQQRDSKRARLLHTSDALPSPSASASAVSEYASVHGVEMTAPFYSRGTSYGLNQQSPDPAPDPPRRHRPLVVHSTPDARITPVWHVSPSSPMAIASPPTRPGSTLHPTQRMPQAPYPNYRVSPLPGRGSELGSGPMLPPPVQEGSPPAAAATIRPSDADLLRRRHRDVADASYLHNPSHFARPSSLLGSSNGVAPPLPAVVGSSSHVEARDRVRAGQYHTASPVRYHNGGSPPAAAATGTGTPPSSAASPDSFSATRALALAALNSPHRSEHDYDECNQPSSVAKRSSRGPCGPLGGGSSSGANDQPRAWCGPNDTSAKPSTLRSSAGCGGPSPSTTGTSSMSDTSANNGIGGSSPSSSASPSAGLPPSSSSSSCPSKEATHRLATKSDGAAAPPPRGCQTSADETRPSGCCNPKSAENIRDRERSKSPALLGMLVDMRGGKDDDTEPCCFGLVECDAEGRIVL